MRGLILSVFPGADLLGKAFQANGWCVVHAPDLMMGGDIREFHPIPGSFDGLIGGPPCQIHSIAKNFASAKKGPGRIDLVPEFVRVFNEGEFKFAVMENVKGIWGHPDIPKDWHGTLLKDVDEGGLTKRERLFYTWPFMMLRRPANRKEAEYSVTANACKGGGIQGRYARRMLKGISAEEAAELQGWPELGPRLLELHGKHKAVKLLGNGVPRALGERVAHETNKWWDQEFK